MGCRSLCIIKKRQEEQKQELQKQEEQKQELQKQEEQKQELQKQEEQSKNYRSKKKNKNYRSKVLPTLLGKKIFWDWIKLFLKQN